MMSVESVVYLVCLVYLGDNRRWRGGGMAWLIKLMPLLPVCPVQDA